MSENLLDKTRRTAHFLRGVCGLLFVLFGFVYQYIFQHDVILLLHSSLSEGKTTYHMLWGSVAVTLILLLLRSFLNKLSRFEGILYAYSFFPAFLFLGMITDVDYEVAAGQGVAPYWLWLFPLLFFLWVVIGKAFQYVAKLFQSGIRPFYVININLLTMLLLSFMTVGIGNQHIQFHHELAVEAAIRNNDIQKVLEIGKKQEDPSRTLTALRNFAFSRDHSLGEHLFELPQLYKESGLLIDDPCSQVLTLTADSLYEYLGSKPYPGESDLGYFRRLCVSEEGTYVALDYYLCALLLHNDLDEFVKQYRQLYLVKGKTVPRFYEEALFLYVQLHPEAKEKTMKWSESLLDRWESYQDSKKRIQYHLGEDNRMQREQGRTYWWYYEYE